MNVRLTLQKSLVALLLILVPMSGLASAGSGASGKASLPPKVVPDELTTLEFTHTGSDFDITQALQQSRVKRARSTTPPVQDEVVAVYATSDGERFAVVDYTLPNAPRGKVVFDGAVLKSLGVSSVKLVTYRDPAQRNPLHKGEPPSGPVPQKPDASTMFYAYYEYFRYPWEYMYSTSNWETTTTAGLPGVGCANSTSTTVQVNCELSAEGSATVEASSNLTASKLANIGFKVGFTVKETVKMTILNIPPYTKYKLTPMVDWANEEWREKQDEYQRTCYVGISLPCTSWQYFGTYYGTGTGKKPALFWGNLTDIQI